MNACSRSFFWQIIIRYTNPFPFHKLHCVSRSSFWRMNFLSPAPRWHFASIHPSLGQPASKLLNKGNQLLKQPRERKSEAEESSQVGQLCDDGSVFRCATDSATIAILMRNVALVEHYRHISWMIIVVSPNIKRGKRVSRAPLDTQVNILDIKSCPLVNLIQLVAISNGGGWILSVLRNGFSPWSY